MGGERMRKSLGVRWNVIGAAMELERWSTGKL